MRNKIILMSIFTSIVFAFYIVNNWIIKNILLTLLLYLLILIYGYIIYKKYLSTYVPDIMKNLTRNYDKIILGDKRLASKQGDLHGSVLDLTNYSRNLYTDILILERWYSFLRNNGTVYFNIDVGSHRCLFEDAISFFDDAFLHQVTLLEHGKDIFSNKYKIIQYQKGLYFLFIKRRNIHINKKKRVLNNEEIQILKDKFNEIEAFCKNRNINVVFNFFNSEQAFI